MGDDLRSPLLLRIVADQALQIRSRLR